LIGKIEKKPCYPVFVTQLEALLLELAADPLSAALELELAAKVGLELKCSPNELSFYLYIIDKIILHL
jgi:hypothetical protein